MLFWVYSLRLYCWIVPNRDQKSWLWMGQSCRHYWKHRFSLRKNHSYQYISQLLVRSCCTRVCGLGIFLVSDWNSWQTVKRHNRREARLAGEREKWDGRVNWRWRLGNRLDGLKNDKVPWFQITNAIPYQITTKYSHQKHGLHYLIDSSWLVGIIFSIFFKHFLILPPFVKFKWQFFIFAHYLGS